MAVGKMPKTHKEEVEDVIPREKPTAASELQIYQEDSAVLVDVGAAHGDLPNANPLKLAKDGHTVLIPQPSDDPLDPLNWSWWKKHAVLLTIGTSAFLAEFQAASGPSCILQQGAEWGLAPTHVNDANNISVLLVGIGGVLSIPFLFFWGRAPLLFWCMALGTLFTLGCILAPNFNTFYALKALQGLTFAGGQPCGLAFVHDMFFFHEQARKIGIWTVLFIASPYLGPMFANYILAGTGNWRLVYWEIFGIGCLNLLFMALFLDETWYRRDIAISAQPPRGNRLARVLGIWQIQHHDQYFGTVLRSIWRLWAVFCKPIILPVMIYYLMNFMWAVGINQTSAILIAAPAEAHGYGFGQLALGYIYFAPIIGSAVGETFGHFFNDFIAKRYIRKHDGIFIPEARLTPLYISAVFMIPGLVLVGQTLNLHLHWVGIMFGWGMYVFGCMVSSVAITNYALDAYPTGSGEVSALINLARLLGGFSVGYFQLEWGLSNGFNVSFGTQAAIVAAGVMIIPVLHIWGPKLRHKGGPLKL